MYPGQSGSDGYNVTRPDQLRCIMGTMYSGQTSSHGSWIQCIPPKPTLLPNLSNKTHCADARPYQLIRMRQNRSIHHRSAKDSQPFLGSSLSMIHSVPTHRIDGVHILPGLGVGHHHNERLEGCAQLEALACLINCGCILLNRRCARLNRFEGDASFFVDTVENDIISPEMNGDIWMRGGDRRRCSRG